MWLAEDLDTFCGHSTWQKKKDTELLKKPNSDYDEKNEITNFITTHPFFFIFPVR